MPATPFYLSRAPGSGRRCRARFRPARTRLGLYWGPWMQAEFREHPAICL